jgi:amino acid transporter
MVIDTLTVAFVLSLLPAFILFGLSSLLEFAWLIAICGLSLTVAFTLIFLAGRIIIVRLTPKRPRPRLILSIIWSVLILTGLVLFTSNLINLPVPKWSQTEAQAAGSMRATVGDMTAFLLELSNPQHLSPEMATQMQTSQVRLNSDLSWGLGPGIQHSRQGDALWQWGQHIDFQSIMIIYPEHNFGVVVCTNNDLLNPDVAMEIAHRALGGKIEPIRRAIHLEFNYNEGD